MIHSVDVKTGKKTTREFTPEEAANNAAAQLRDAPTAEQLADAARQVEYEAKGWFTPYDVIDDILARGNLAVRDDRDAIKSRHPKE